MKKVKIDVTTDSGGDGTGNGEASVGLVYAVQLVDGDFADGVDLTLTSEHENLSIPILVKADFNSDQMVYPRVAEALNTDGTALSTYAYPLCFGRPKAVVAQGGATKSGSFILYLIEA